MVAHQNMQRAWQQSKLGKLLADAEIAELGEVLPRLYGYHLLQIGDPELASFSESSKISHKIVLFNEGQCSENRSLVQSSLESFPVRKDCIDVVLLTHTLESMSDPHFVLREAYRSLLPEGVIVVTGFNPFSLIGLWYTVKKWFSRGEKRGKLWTAFRIKDWLGLLDFEIMGSRTFYFSLPIANQKVNQHLGFLEKLGSKLWPFFGGSYVIIARKRVVTLTPVRPRWRPKKRVWVSSSEEVGTTMQSTEQKEK